MARRDPIIKVLGILVGVVFVFLVVLEIQVQQLQKSNRDLNAVVVDTQHVLNNAVNNPANAGQAAATAHALVQIAAIEFRLCGGPCPPPPPPGG